MVVQILKFREVNENDSVSGERDVQWVAAAAMDGCVDGCVVLEQSGGQEEVLTRQEAGWKVTTLDGSLPEAVEVSGPKCWVDRRRNILLNPIL